MMRREVATNALKTQTAARTQYQTTRKPTQPTPHTTKKRRELCGENREEERVLTTWLRTTQKTTQDACVKVDNDSATQHNAADHTQHTTHASKTRYIPHIKQPCSGSNCTLPNYPPYPLLFLPPLPPSLALNLLQRKLLYLMNSMISLGYLFVRY